MKKEKKSQQNLLVRVGELFLGLFGSRIGEKLSKAGFLKKPVKSLGWVVIAGFFIAVLWTTYFMVNGAFNYFGTVTAIVIIPFLIVISFVIIMVAEYILFRIYIEVKTYRRIQLIEKRLPDFLREFSINLRAGREFVDAFEASTTKDLGPLHEDISKLVIGIRSGETISSTLKGYIIKYDSYIIQETFSVIHDAYTGGGGLSEIIDRIADHLDVIDHLKKKAIASVSNYTIFMTIVSLVISPLLFALSYNLINLIKTLLDRVIAAGSTEYLPSFLVSLNINFHAFVIFSELGVALIAGSAAAIMGIIRSGNLRGASVLFLIYVAVSIIVYRLSLLLLTTFFSAIFTL